MTPFLHSLRVGRPRTIDGEDPWRTAFFKEPATGAVHLRRDNLDGDAQADLTVHGGPDKAVCVYALSHYALWSAELGVKECGPGWFGENFTVDGQTEDSVSIGDRYAVGGAVVEVSQPRGPCWKLGMRWNRDEMPKLIVRTGRSGWYFRVRQEGRVRAGDSLTLIDRPHARWTIALVNEITYSRGPSARASRPLRAELAACESLAAQWRAGLYRS
jgi:MOSC domain-containing protein YiiM